jgi:formylglycine-generating enzyme required for sulfatase activity
VKSDRCTWEVDKTLALSKRLIPVIFKPVSQTDITERLRRLQFIRFDVGVGITRPLAQLAEALRQDLDWIREHTRLSDLGARWQARGRPSSLLLRDDDLDAARAWAGKRRSEAPEITETQIALLSASIAASPIARRRRHQGQALVGALATVIVAGFAAYWNEPSLKSFYYWVAHVRGNVLKADDERKLKPGESFWECSKSDENYSNYCPEMVVVPAGKFKMGSDPPRNEFCYRGDDEGPQHEVTIAQRFAVSKFEVTFDQWDACLQTDACTLPEAGRSVWGRGKQPAINISWEDVQQYVKWLSGLTAQHYRLLSEAEWEYAAARTYFACDDPNPSSLRDYAWYTENSGSRTHPVGEKKPNSFELYDMYGNVWEWVEDCYHDSYRGSPTDGSAWTGDSCSRRVVRGGSWGDHSQSLRQQNRSWFSFDYRSSGLGFRVGRTLTR